MKLKNVIPLFFFMAGITSCSNYGDKVSRDYLEVYYKDGISREEAQKTLEYLLPIWKNNGEKTSQKSLQLSRNGDTINFKMVSVREIADTMDEEVFYITGNEISDDVFDQAPVNIILTDKYFKTLRTYTFKKITRRDFGERIISGNVEVFSKNSSGDDEARRLADYLSASFKPESLISFQFSHEEQGIFVRMVSDREKATALGESEFYITAGEISRNVFDGAPVIYQLTNDKFEPFKSFEYHGEMPAGEKSSGKK